MGTIAIVYARRSGDRESESIDDQVRAGRELPEVAACDRIEVIRDAGLSGGDPNRPGLLELYGWLDDPDVKVVAFYHQDRLARDEEINAVLGRLMRARPDISIHSVTQGRVKFDAAGRLMWGIHGAFAAYYRATVSERMVQSYAGRRARGAFIGPTPPYGYRRTADKKNIEPDPERAPILLRIFELAADGLRLKDVAGILNAEGAPPPGWLDHWIPATMGRILKLRVYVGEHQDGRQGAWPALVSHGLFQRVQARMREFRAVGNVKREYPFRGMARCICGTLLAWHANRPGTPRETRYGYCGTRDYSPAERCQHASKGADERTLIAWMDAIVGGWEAKGLKLADYAAKREATARLAAVRIAEIDRRIASLDVRLDVGTITPERFRAELADRRRDRKALEEQLGEPPIEDLSTLPAQWRAGDAKERRELLMGLFQSVTVADGQVVGYEPRADRWSRVHLLVGVALDDDDADDEDIAELVPHLEAIEDLARGRRHARPDEDFGEVEP